MVERLPVGCRLASPGAARLNGSRRAKASQAGRTAVLVNQMAGCQTCEYFFEGPVHADDSSYGPADT
jgi:hypothetical protein